MKTNKILISTSSFAKHTDQPLKVLQGSNILYTENPYGRKLEEREVCELLSKEEYVGMIAGTENLSAKALAAAPFMKVISRVGVGIDNIDLRGAQERDIKVFNTPDVLIDSVAELTLGLILDAFRKISFQNNLTHQGKWEKHFGNLLKGKNVGILGFGKIGQRVASLLKGFGCRVLYYDQLEMISENCEKVSFDGLLQQSDIISVHASSKATLLGPKEFQNLKKGAVLINTARGHLVDEEALYQALQSGRVSFAALDVFSKEPYQGKLQGLPNVILTPHIGSYAVEARIEMETQSVNNLIQGLKEAGLL